MSTWIRTPTPLGLTIGELLGIFGASMLVLAIVLALYWWCKDRMNGKE